MSKEIYLEVMFLIEKTHRQFLDAVKLFLEKENHDQINNVQAMILYHIGEEKLTVGELTHRGYYLGSNVSYNVKKMVESGYLLQKQAPHDKRSSKVELSDKGTNIYQALEAYFEQASGNLPRYDLSFDELHNLSKAMRNIEVFLSSLR